MEGSEVDDVKYAMTNVDPDVEARREAKVLKKWREALDALILPSASLIETVFQGIGSLICKIYLKP